MRIGPYEVLDELGRGGMGVVHRARSADGRLVALKVFAGHDQADSFEREVRLLGSFSQAEGFVPVLDSGTENGRCFLVMPLLPGGSLRARLQKGGVAVADAVAIVARVAFAMGRAHARGIVHRDLKPENVLFDASGAPLVADLGLAKHFRRDTLGASKSQTATEAGVIAGTPGYMAPEQIEDAARARPPADVFALGAILYEALAGKKPFEGAGLLGYTDALQRTTPVRPSRLRSDVPRWLDDALARALEKEEDARFPDAAAFARALRAGKGTRRQRPVAIALALLLAAAPLAWVFHRRAVRAELMARIIAESRAQHFDRVIDDATRLIELDPRHASAWTYRGDARCRKRDLDRAIADLSRAIEIAPAVAAAWSTRGWARLDKGDVDGAVADATRGLELDPGLSDAWTCRCDARLRKGDVAGATTDATRAIELDERNAHAWGVRATIRVNESDFAAAIADATRSIQLQPKNDGRVWLVRGQARLMTRDTVQALADATKALELAPDLHEAWCVLAQARLARDDYEGALSDATAALTRQPDMAAAWVCRGTAHALHGDLESALSDFSRALELGPGLADARSRRGEVRLRMNDLDGAIADATRAIEIAPDVAGSWVNRGDARGRKGDGAGALADTTRAVEIAPEDAYTWLERGRARLQQGDRAGAASDFERALELKPDGPDSAVTRELLEEARRGAR